MTVHRETVNDLLWNSLTKLMSLEYLSEFRLVGGTSLSLLIGHRVSVDIDMFTDNEYGSIDFKNILSNLKADFPYVDHNDWVNESMGNSCFIGNTSDDVVKLDLFYTDAFVYPIIPVKQIRLSSLEEIVAMKLDVIGRGGRKKDFWDIHALLNHFDLKAMFDIYIKRYPYNFTKEELISQLTMFENADTDPDPNCLQRKYWELIKYDFEEEIQKLSET